MFKLNQRVWSHIFGWGVVVRLTNNFVTVKPDASNFQLERYFCCDGKVDKRDLFPSLFHNEVTEWPNPAPPKPDLTGKEILVSNDGKKWHITNFVKWDGDRDKLICKGSENYELSWNYYKEIKDV